MLALAIDTTSRSGSVALVRDGAVLTEFLIDSEINHSETVMPAVNAVFEIGKLAMDDVDFFAFAQGPGSFTGLRIGAGILKGFALGTGKPVVGVSSLDALARNVFAPACGVCPMLDAKRDEVYTAVYERPARQALRKTREEMVVNPREFLGTLDGDYIFLGDGALRYQGLITELIPGRSIIAPDNLCRIRASEVGLLGMEKFREGKFLDLLTFTPVYLRKPQAERS